MTDSLWGPIWGYINSIRMSKKWQTCFGVELERFYKTKYLTLPCLLGTIPSRSPQLWFGHPSGSCQDFVHVLSHSSSSLAACTRTQGTCNIQMNTHVPFLKKEKAIGWMQQNSFHRHLAIHYLSSFSAGTGSHW